jgi:tRNA (guanine37-N1)-methyltransferase
MRIDLLTCLPELIRPYLGLSILGRAQAAGVAELHVHDLHTYSDNKHRKTDDYPYGGGAGMVMSIQPIAACIRALQVERSYDQVIFLTPDGIPLTQPLVNQLSLAKNLIVLSGHYKGVDERARQAFVTLEASIGDYVLTGGELPALVLTDAIVRLLPGAISDETSALSDSFQDGLLAPPVYTRPAEWEGLAVPEVLLSGNDRLIREWREQQALARTRQRRPDLLAPSDGAA